MLRSLFVLSLASVGGYFALRSTFYALLLYLWIAYFRPESWVWGDFIAALNLSWWAGAYLVGRAVLLGEAARIDGRRALLLLVLLQSFLSLWFSVDFDYSWGYWVDFAKALVITLLIASLAADPARYRLVLVTIALSLGFEATKQGWAQLLVNPGGQNFNRIPFLGDNNGVAIGILMLVPILAALAQTTQNKPERYVCRLMLVGVLYRAISTYSRGGFIACLALGGYYLFRSPHRMRSLVGVLVAGAIVLPVLPDAFWERMGTITTDEEEMDTSARGRLHFWQVAVEMAVDRPVTGVGHNAYNQAYDDYDFLDGEYGNERSVHSAWLGVLSELGIPGFLLVAMNVLLAFRSCRRVRRLEGGSPELDHLRRYAIALEASLVVALVGGTFVIFQYAEMLWHFMGLSIALESAASKAASERNAGVPSEPRPPVPWWSNREDAA